MKTFLIIVCCLLFIQSTFSQTSFQPQQIIYPLGAAYAIHSADIDGDGLADIISSSTGSDNVSWYRNNGGGTSFTEFEISNDDYVVWVVYAVDLDSDGDNDIIVGTYDDVRWYENDGLGYFSYRKIITNNVDVVKSVHAGDLDGDGDLDVVYASMFDSKVGFSRNRGDGTFDYTTTIVTGAADARCVYAVDIDNDSILDVVYSSYSDNNVSWNKNLGDAVFGGRQVIGDNLNGAIWNYAADLDNDGDKDILSGSTDDSKKAIYKNNFNSSIDYFEVFCVGDSAYILGQWVHDPGHFYDSLNTIYGGDSIENYYVAVFFPPNTFNIVGNPSVVEYEIHTYSAPVSLTHTYEWEVQNGNIVEYFANNSIAIHWGAWGSGRVKATAIIPETGCASSDSLMVSISGVGISEPTSKIARALPNPADSYLFINTPDINLNVEILNNSGKSTILSKDRKIDVSELKDGIYYVLYKDEVGKTVGQKTF